MQVHDGIDTGRLLEQWRAALAEDGVDHDVTCAVSLEPGRVGQAVLASREAGVFAGRVLLDLLTDAYRGQLVIQPLLADGAVLEPGRQIATLSGPLPQMLGLERTLLNFLERLCGVASLTRRFVDAVAGTPAKIYDTRKTLPGWRMLDKYAVRCGGGYNHRMGLHDAVLVKDNHIAHLSLEALTAAAAEMVARAQALPRKPDFIEFEVDRLEQLDALLAVEGIDVILLDNFTCEQMAEAVRRRDRAGRQDRCTLEASGGIRIETVRRIAQTGIDRIAIGALTHSAVALDIGMDVPD